MCDFPILMPAEYWMNSQLSLARFSGAIKLNGYEYFVFGIEKDLIRKDWIPVLKKLGRERTIKLINNGTSLEVVKQMIKMNIEL